MANAYAEDTDFQKANEAFEKARFAEALRLYEQALERYPEEPEVLVQVGLCAFEHALQRMERDASAPDDWRRAVRHLEAALEVSGENKVVESLAVAHHNLGVHLNQMESYDLARVQFLRALGLKPEMTQASVNLAINYTDQGEFDKAENLLRAAVESAPENMEARFTLGLILSSQGKDDEAIAQFKAAQTPEGDMADIHYNLGVSYANQDRLQLAEAAFRQVLELNPQFVPALYNLGLILRQKEELAGAERCFEEVTRLEPDSPGGHFCLASLYEKRSPSRAIPVWERYLELAAGRPSEAELVAKVARHVAALKKQVEEAQG